MSEHVAALPGGETNSEAFDRATGYNQSSDGVVADTDLSVSEAGTPNNTVVVAAGGAHIGYDSPNAGRQYKTRYVRNSADYAITITANSSGNDRIDAIVAYVDTTAYGTSNNDGALILDSVDGTPGATPVAPTDSAIQTAVGGAGVPWILLAHVDVADGFSSITDSNITDMRPLSGTLDRAASALADHVVTGLVWSQDSGLVGNMTLGRAWIDGELVNKPIISKTFTASKDTYVDLPKTAKPTTNNDLTFTEVANGGTAPALASGSIRLAKVVTNGSAITSVQTSGEDENNVAIRNTGSMTSAKMQYPLEWQEIGRTTLGSSATSITVSDLPPMRYLKVILSIVDGNDFSGGFRFNGDTGSNYAHRGTNNGQYAESGTNTADQTESTSASYVTVTAFSSNVDHVRYLRIDDLINIAGQEKVGNYFFVDDGANGNEPDRRIGSFKWDNTSDLITSVSMIRNSGSGTLNTDTEMIVYGHN